MNNFKKIQLLLFTFVFLLSTGTYANKLYLEPAYGELIKNCDNPIDIMIDSNRTEILWAAIHLKYDSKNIRISSFYPNTDFNLPVEHKNNVKEWTFVWGLLSMHLKDHEQYGFKGKTKYGTIYIRNVEEIDNTKLILPMTYPWDAKDENDIYRLLDGGDVLDSVQNGTYTFVEGECPKIDKSIWSNLLDEKNPADLLQKNIDVLEKEFAKWWTNYKIFIYAIPILILILMWITVLRRQGKGTKTKKTNNKKIKI